MMIIKRILLARKIHPTLQGSRYQWRAYSEGSAPKVRSAHAQWYSTMAPAMIPVFLLGSAVYLGLQLTHQKLAHEKFMEEALVRVTVLEAEVHALQEKRERATHETVLPASDTVKAKKSGWW